MDVCFSFPRLFKRVLSSLTCSILISYSLILLNYLCMNMLTLLRSPSLSLLVIISMGGMVYGFSGSSAQAKEVDLRDYFNPELPQTSTPSTPLKERGTSYDSGTFSSILHQTSNPDNIPRPSEFSTFLPEPSPVISRPSPIPGTSIEGENQESQVVRLPQNWWILGADSPLAIAIGMAEGTRQWDGTKNPAYYWHTDPGNGANNVGTFSYQHLSPNEIQAVETARGASKKRQISAQLDLPTVADQRQLQKLRQFQEQLRQMAIAKGITLNQEELINGLDLANQSEAAAFSHWGFIDRLAQMRQLVTDPAEQLTEARVWSYWCPKRNQWDAPGLNNNYEDIRRDQERRQKAIHRFFSRQTWHDWIANVPLSEQMETQARRIINW